MSYFSALRGLRSLNRHIQTRSLRIGIRLYSNRYLTALPGVRSGSIDCSYSCVCPKNVFQATKRLFLNKDRFNQVQSPFVQSAWRFCSSSASEEGRLIYTGNLGKAVLGVKFFSYSSSMFSLCVMPYLLLKTGVGVQSLALQVAFCSVVGFFTFLTPVLLHLITKGYVVRLYHRPEEDTYTAVTYNALLVEKATVFHQRDVRIPDVSRMFTSFYANGRPMLVNPMLFALPQEYNHLMGYDRPFTFDLEEVQKPDKS